MCTAVYWSPEKTEAYFDFLSNTEFIFGWYVYIHVQVVYFKKPCNICLKHWTYSTGTKETMNYIYKTLVSRKDEQKHLRLISIN